MTPAHRSPRGARTEDVRRRNLSSLLTSVHVRGATPRSSLTAELGLNRSTIGDLTAELAAAGLVEERTGAPPESPTGGRPSYVVEPASRSVQVIAIDLGVTHLTVARVGLGGEILSRRDLSHRRGPKRVRRVVRTIGALCRELLDELPAGATCVGAGAAVPGMVRTPDGLVRHVPNLGWSDVPLGAELALELGLPVTVGNDADLGALAEHVLGAAVGCDDVVYLSGHSGIGAGIFVSGRPLAGSRGYAGEVGHVVVKSQGQDCRCGSRGCWETEAGEERLFELAGAPPWGGLDGVRAVVAAAAAGDARSTRAVRHVATWLGRGTANVVNAFNPEVVILGGALTEIHAAAADHVQAALESLALAASLENLRLLAPAFGNDSTLVGAAELAFAPLLTDPLLEMSKRHTSDPPRREEPR